MRLRDVAFLSIINSVLVTSSAMALSLLVLPYEITAIVVSIILYLLISIQINRKPALTNYLEGPAFIILIITVIFFFINK